MSRVIKGLISNTLPQHFAREFCILSRKSMGNISRNPSTAISRCSRWVFVSAPTRIRTEVLALKGLRPSPLDDGGEPRDFTTPPMQGQAITGQKFRPIPGYGTYFSGIIVTLRRGSSPTLCVVTFGLSRSSICTKRRSLAGMGSNICRRPVLTA
jgi:hypothetical protein